MAIFKALSSTLGSIAAHLTSWPGPRNARPRSESGKTDPPPVTSNGQISVTATGTARVYQAGRDLHIAQVNLFDVESDVESTVERELPTGWVEALDELPPDARREAARRLWAQQVTRIGELASELPNDESDLDSTVERNLPAGWLSQMDKLTPEQRVVAARILSRKLDSGISPEMRSLWLSSRPDPVIVATSTDVGFDVVSFKDPPEQLSPEEGAAVADRSGSTIDHALAMLFIRLGPPPEPTELDYAPAGNGGGGAQQ
ncbi:hypothetical protein ABZ946_34845 [Streptomyces sp. NPDC046324]|uniref:hypothetical protein n=1 Tax=Streptomyces sp. NPDC046324 TaxID=3154915 RepID=UPI0033D22264